MSEPGEPSPLALEVMAEANLRRSVMEWAVSTAKTGEAADAIVARAQAYFEFVTRPLQANSLRDRLAMQERGASALQ